MQVTQIQVANDSIQDRLLLRIGTAGNEEVRVHITRRYLRELWPHLVVTLADQLASNPANPVTASPTESTDSGQAANQPTATFDQPYRNENPTFPLGSKPILATEATLDAKGHTNARLIIREGRERAFTLNLNSDLLQALCAMLRAAGQQAQWDLALDYASPPPPTAERDAVTTPTPNKRHLLH